MTFWNLFIAVLTHHVLAFPYLYFPSYLFSFRDGVIQMEEGGESHSFQLTLTLRCRQDWQPLLRVVLRAILQNA